MPTSQFKQTEQVLSEVSQLLARFENIRDADNSSTREIQKLAARIDSQFARINTALESVNRLQRLLNSDSSPIGGALSSFASPTENTPRRSQDEVTHLISRLVASGFDNF